MTSPKEPLQRFDLAPDEIASVESFRRLKDTAVLTIMFTDIVGFTELTEEKGERHSNEVRRLHDEVLEAAVTDGDAGLVVKHIGDAIMAVFSEPSTAVERALRIHDGLDRLARDRPDIDALGVKIGLDMGQVTVEEKVDVDVFGRHVNRASRIQGLAGGGQVLMSFTVFDSARGWLTGPADERFEWRSHGRYRLKGVPAPVEIFEVGDPARAPLRAPRGGSKARTVPGLAWAAGFVLLGVAGTIGYSRLGSAEVWLADYAPPLSYLDESSIWTNPRRCSSKGNRARRTAGSCWTSPPERTCCTTTSRIRFGTTRKSTCSGERIISSRSSSRAGFRRSTATSVSGTSGWRRPAKQTT
jgi:class 3 adenylate cyclase